MDLQVSRREIRGWVGGEKELEAEEMVAMVAICLEFVT